SARSVADAICAPAAPRVRKRAGGGSASLAAEQPETGEAGAEQGERCGLGNRGRLEHRAADGELSAEVGLNGGEAGCVQQEAQVGVVLARIDCIASTILDAGAEVGVDGRIRASVEVLQIAQRCGDVP